MAEHEAPLLVLAANVGNNGSIRLLWRSCQAGKHFLFILAVGMARGMLDPPHACPRAGREDRAGAAGHVAAAGAVPAAPAPTRTRDSPCSSSHSATGTDSGTDSLLSCSPRLWGLSPFAEPPPPRQGRAHPQTTGFPHPNPSSRVRPQIKTTPGQARGQQLWP